MAPSARTTARSDKGSVPTTRNGTVVPSANAAWPASAFPTTWALVSRNPSSVKTTADPAPAAILPSRRRWDTCTAATRGVSCSATETTTWEYASSGVRSGSDERVRVSAIEAPGYYCITGLLIQGSFDLGDAGQPEASPGEKLWVPTDRLGAAVRTFLARGLNELEWLVYEHMFAPQLAWDEGLDETQLAVATHGETPLVVVAGAGTGKTRALTSRVACLLDRGVAPDRILLLTFTRRAADEMVARARDLVGLRGGERPQGGTFHAVAHRHVASYAEVLNLPPGFGVLDPAGASDLMDLLRSDHALTGTSTRFPRASTLVDIYSRCINTERPLRDVVPLEYPWCEPHLEVISELFREFTARKRSSALLDFDDLLLYWRALMSHDELGPHLAERFRYVLVDEYQDLNSLQVDIVRLLAPERKGPHGGRRRGPSHLRLPGVRSSPPTRNSSVAIPTLRRCSSNATSDRGRASSMWPMQSDLNRKESRHSAYTATEVQGQSRASTAATTPLRKHGPSSSAYLRPTRPGSSFASKPCSCGPVITVTSSKLNLQSEKSPIASMAACDSSKPRT